MQEFAAPDPNFAARVRASFERQRLMRTLGAELARVAAGEVDIVLPFRADLTQQHGFLHAGVLTAIADSACGYAALSLMPEDAAVLSVEYKINLMAPARGESVTARGRVVRAGRTIYVCNGDVHARHDGRETHVAAMLATMMCVRDRPDLRG